MTIETISAFFGGIGFSLLGLHLMTEGLKIAGGATLRGILERSTRTPARGIFSGILITSLVQSSGAVTVATIGFVNAGLIDLVQAIAIVYGSNIGHTMIGWLVSLVNFQSAVKTAALPLIGIGMLFHLGRGRNRYAALGETLAGFGIFFTGIDLLKTSFAGHGSIQMLTMNHDPSAYFSLFFIGLLLTVIMQSSSATVAIVLSAAGSGLLPFTAGASLIIGANLGSTSTAAIAAFGATPNAKRVAAAHVLSSMVTGMMAGLLLLGLAKDMLPFPDFLRLSGNATVALALFHTSTNVLGVCLIWPFTGGIAKRLRGWFRSHEENEALPLYLDRNIATTPVLAFHALALEIERIGDIARRMAKAAMSSESGPGRQLETDRHILRKLEIEVGNFINLIRRGSLPEKLDHALPNALRVTSYYREVADVSLRIAQMLQQSRPVANTTLAGEIELYKKQVVKLLELTAVGRKDYDQEHCAELFAETEEMYRHIKSSLLKAGSKSLLPVGQMVFLIDLMSDIRRIADQIEKGALYLTTLTRVTPDQSKDSGQNEAGEAKTPISGKGRLSRYSRPPAQGQGNGKASPGAPLP